MVSLMMFRPPLCLFLFMGSALGLHVFSDITDLLTIVNNNCNFISRSAEDICETPSPGCNAFFELAEFCTDDNPFCSQRGPPPQLFPDQSPNYPATLRYIRTANVRFDVFLRSFEKLDVQAYKDLYRDINCAAQPSPLCILINQLYEGTMKVNDLPTVSIQQLILGFPPIVIPIITTTTTTTTTTTRTTTTTTTTTATTTTTTTTTTATTTPTTTTTNPTTTTTTPTTTTTNPTTTTTTPTTTTTNPTTTTTTPTTTTTTTTTTITTTTTTTTIPTTTTTTTATTTTLVDTCTRAGIVCKILCDQEGVRSGICPNNLTCCKIT